MAVRFLKDDGDPISPQYFNDLERNRRNPSSPTLLKQFAAALNLPTDYLDFLAGRLPDNLRSGNYAPDKVQAAFHAFRRSLRCDGSPR